MSPLQELSDTRRTRTTRKSKRAAAPPETTFETLQSETTESLIYDAPPQSSEDAHPAQSASAEQLGVSEIVSEPFIESTSIHPATSIEHPMSSVHMHVAQNFPISPILQSTAKPLSARDESITADPKKTQHFMGPLGTREFIEPSPFFPNTGRDQDAIYEDELGDDDFVIPRTPPHISNLMSERQVQGLVHIWFHPSPKTMSDTSMPNYQADVSMAMPLPSIAQFLKACHAGPTKKLKISTTVPPEKQPTKRKLPGDEPTEQPTAKRSKVTPALSTNTTIKIHGRVNQNTGRIQGRAYTVEGDRLVLDPYKPNMAIYNDVDKDDFFMSYDPVRRGFFYPSAYILAKKNVARKKAKAAVEKAAQEAAAKEAEEVAAKEAAAEAKKKAAAEEAALEAIILNSRADEGYQWSSQSEEDSEEELGDQSDKELEEEAQDADEDVVQLGHHSKIVASEAENVQQAPPTPSSTWTIGNLARSVTKFVPSISSFGRSTARQLANTSASAPSATAPSTSALATRRPQSVSTSTSRQTTVATEPSQNQNEQPMGDLARALQGTVYAKMYGYDRPLPAPRLPRSVYAVPRSASAVESRNRPAIEHTNDLRSARRSSGSTLKTKAQKLAENKEKKRKAVLLGAKKLIEEEVERRVQEQLAANSQPGSKRKRTSSDAVPVVPAAPAAPTSPGRTYGFSYSDFSSSEESGDEEAPETPTRPAKRPRVSPVLPTNIEQTSGRTFFVPDSHSSDSDEVESPQLPAIPPQRPTPAHARLPAKNWDPVADQRARALQFSPAKQSNLRIINRLSSSTVAPSSPAPEVLAQQSQPIPSSSEQQQLVPNVAAAVAAIPTTSLAQINFPAPRNYAEAGFIDPIVQAALDNLWGPADDARADAIFTAQFTSWKAHQQPTTPSTLTT